MSQEQKPIEHKEPQSDAEWTDVLRHEQELRESRAQEGEDSHETFFPGQPD